MHAVVYPRHHSRDMPSSASIASSSFGGASSIPPGLGEFHLSGSGNGGIKNGRASRNAAASPVPLPLSRGTANATPEDRQRAVAQLMARGGSFSERHEAEEELTPDASDTSPSSSPKLRGMNPFGNSTAFSQMVFDKEEIPKSRSFTSGLAGAIHRPSVADGQPIIQTPDRYGTATVQPVPPAEYSESGQRKAKLYKCAVFLPIKEEEGQCVRVELKPGTTAQQLVLLLLGDYLRTHPQPEPSMLGRPETYRLYIGEDEDDGEIDDSFPPLDPSATVSSTAAECLVLQRKIPASSTQSTQNTTHRTTMNNFPTSSSSSDIGAASKVGAGESLPSASHHLGMIHQQQGHHRPRVLSQSISSSGDELSTFDEMRDEGRSELREDDGRDGNEDDEEANTGASDAYRTTSPRGNSGNSKKNSKGSKAHRTSSDADEEQRDPHDNANRNARSDDTSAPQRSRSFTPFTWRSCLKCSCFGTAEEAEAIEPNSNSKHQRRRSSIADRV